MEDLWRTKLMLVSAQIAALASHFALLKQSVKPTVCAKSMPKLALAAALAKANALALPSANKAMRVRTRALWAFFALSAPFFAQNSSQEIAHTKSEPVLIKELAATDEAFKTFVHLVEESDKAFYINNRKRQVQAKKSGTRAPLEPDTQAIELFCYKCKKGDKLLSLSAALNLPYDTIATVNGISAMDAKLEGRKLLLPSAKGLFIPTKAKSDLDILLYKEYIEGKPTPKPLDIEGTEYLFLQGLRFSSTQRAFFMDKGFRLPLDKVVVSSEFGGRMSPVYNRWKDHKGIDFAAPVGDKIYACKNGTVAYVFLNDKVFGNYVILSHDNKMTSVYAHMSKVLVEKGQTVSAGSVLGLVGATGAATGPHLHFELRLAGDAKNPRDYLKL